MGRKKLLEDKITEVPKDLEVLPSNGFCKSCKNTNIREVKDTLIIIFNVMYQVADQLDIIGEDWKSTCNNLKKWCITQKKAKEQKVTKKKRVVVVNE